MPELPERITVRQKVVLNPTSQRNRQDTRKDNDRLCLII